MHSNPTSPTKGDLVRVDMNARTLNAFLEYIFQFTIKRESEGGLYFIESEDKILNAENVSTLVCVRLMEDSSLASIGGAIGYLFGCFKRVMQKENLSGNDIIRMELSKYVQ